MIILFYKYNHIVIFIVKAPVWHQNGLTHGIIIA